MFHDQDTVILAINSAAAAKLALETRVGFKRSVSGFFIIISRYCLENFVAHHLPLWLHFFYEVCCVFSGLLLSCGKYWPFLWQQFPLYSTLFSSYSIIFQVLDQKHGYTLHQRGCSALHGHKFKSAVVRFCTGPSYFKIMALGDGRVL